MFRADWLTVDGALILSVTVSDIINLLATALADRYTIEKELGAGGMATVYLARDLKHNRSVAIKVLKPALAATIGAERFLKEIEIAARLTHPHIVPLHDSGEVSGFLYYVMPYINGESLRALLNRVKCLDPTATIEIVTRVGDALSYAHRQGVVHRDIKPENILFAEGHPLVADFGIARAVSTASGAELTRTGFPVGTPGYMSPEQAAGVRELKASADVYSLACVCYEMLIGETHGLWLTDEAVKVGRFIDASSSHRERLDTLSGSIEQALARALALRPDDRTASVQNFVDALTRSAGARRKFDEAEVKQIVKHASEMQVQHPTEDEALTLGGVQQIAAEVGISPERINRAAQHIERQQRSPTPAVSRIGRVFLGADTVLLFERTVDGEVPESAFEEMIAEIQSTFGAVGQVGTLGKSLWWSTPHSGPGVGRAVQVTITPRAGSTRVRVEERLGELARRLFGGVVGGAGGGGSGGILAVSMSVFNSPAVAFAGVAVWLTTTYVATRTFFRGTTRKRSAELEMLADHLAQLGDEAIDNSER